jgi:flagella basal body P-ring formation protein FlgA
VRRILALAFTLAFLPAAAVAEGRDPVPARSEGGLGGAPRTPHVMIRLAPEVTVHGDEIALSEIADVEGDGPLADRLRALRLVPAPPPGATQPVAAETVRARLITAGPDAARVPLAGAARVQVTRAFQTVRGADLVEAVRRDARTRLESAESRGEPTALVPISRPEDLKVPTGDLRLDTHVHEGTAGAPTLAATVTVRVNGRERHRAVLTFQVTRLVSVLVAARPLEPRRLLGADDFRQERRPVGEVPPDALREVPDATDLEATRPVQAGEVLSPRVLRTKIAVKRGELVTLLLEGEGFRITTQGRASEDARRGDAVRVLNVSSKREVLGWVEGGGVVRVPYRKLGAER